METWKMEFDMQHEKIWNKVEFFQHFKLKASYNMSRFGRTPGLGYTGSRRSCLLHTGRTWCYLQDRYKCHLLYQCRNLHLLHCPHHCHLLHHFLHHHLLLHQYWHRNLHFWVSLVDDTKSWWLMEYILKEQEDHFRASSWAIFEPRSNNSRPPPILALFSKNLSPMRVPNCGWEQCYKRTDVQAKRKGEQGHWSPSNDPSSPWLLLCFHSGGMNTAL